MRRLAVALVAVLALSRPLWADPPVELHFKLLPLASGNVDKATVAATEDVFQRRLMALGMQASQITPSQDTLSVELPAGSDAEAAESLLIRPGVLSFRFKKGAAWQAVLTSPHVRLAEVIQSPTNHKPVVRFELMDSSVSDVARITSQHVGQSMGIFVDDEVVSTPVLQEGIQSGDCVVDGNFSSQEAHRIAALLSGGPLPVKVVLAL